MVLQATNSTAVAQTKSYDIFRNGLGETLRASAQAQLLFAQCQSDQIESMVASHYIYLVCAVVVLLLGTSLQVPALVQLQKTSRLISHSIQHHSVHVFIEQKKRVVDRLNKRYDQELDYGIEDPFQGRRVETRLYNPALLLGGAVGSFVCVCLVFYLVLYFRLMLRLADTVNKLPILMNQEANRNLAISEAFIWMRESLDLQDFLRLMPSYSLVPSPMMQLASATLQFRSTSQYILQRTSLFSPKHFQELYESSSLPSPYTHYGWRSGMRQYFQDVSACCYSSCEGLDKLYDLQTQAANQSTAMIALYSEDVRQEAAAQLAVVLGLLAAGSILLVFALFCGIIPANQVTYSRAKVMWKLCTILPSRQLQFRLREVTK